MANHQNEYIIKIKSCQYFSKNFKAFSKSDARKYLNEFIQERETNKPPLKTALSICLAEIIRTYFEYIPLNVSESVLISLLKDKDAQNIDDIYFCIAENFNRLNKSIRDMFFQASYNENSRLLIANALNLNYEKFPKYYREKLLQVLVNQQSSIITKVGYILHSHFNSISKETKESLLLKIENNPNNIVDFISIIIDNYKTLPDHIVEKLFELAERDEKTISEFLFHLDHNYSYDQIPPGYWDRLCTLFVNNVLDEEGSHKVSLCYLINILIKYRDRLRINTPDILLDIFEKYDLDKTRIYQLEYFFSSLNDQSYVDKFEKIKQVKKL